MEKLEGYLKKIPEFKGANWLIRTPLAIVFILQGLQKLPLNIEDAEAFGLPMTVWFFVAWGELFAGILLFVGGLTIALRPGVGDVLTRFSGIVICGIMTGVILISEPESIMYVILYEHFHLMLYCGGLFFALRGNRVK
jgi:putative oxidoreductase|tara:strand:- start:269 stop:682 length:414 start_codon:yes stop_codon:yes gene_type:complete